MLAREDEIVAAARPLLEQSREEALAAAAGSWAMAPVKAQTDLDVCSA